MTLLTKNGQPFDIRLGGTSISSGLVHAFRRRHGPCEGSVSTLCGGLTVRLRTKVTKGAGSREAGMAMAFKLLDAAQARWRRINGHELVPLVRARATFIDGKLRERKEAQPETTDTDKTGSVAA